MPQTRMWKPPNWPEPDDDLGRYVFGLGTEEGGGPAPVEGRNGRPPKKHDEGDSSQALRPNGEASSASSPAEIIDSERKDSKRGQRGRVSCKLCEKSFFDKSTLNRHVAVIHEKRRSAVCEFCSKTFTKNASLKQHVKVRLIPDP